MSFDLSFNHIMGLLCLGILWVNTLLIAGAAAIELRRLWRRRRRMAPWVTARIVEGLGPQQALASFTVAQRGRARGEGPILFHDQGFSSTLHGGTVEVSTPNGPARLQLAPTADGTKVWVSRHQLAAAGACPGAEVFAQSRQQATKAKGWARSVTAALQPNPTEHVWLPQAVVNGDVSPAWISGIHPGKWMAARAWLVMGFITGTLLLAGAITVVACWPPVFGTVSTLGAAAGVAFFLGVQPIGVAVRDLCRPPHRAYLRGKWLPPSQSAVLAPSPKGA